VWEPNNKGGKMKFRNGLNIFKLHMTDEEVDSMSVMSTTPRDPNDIMFTYFLIAEDILGKPVVYETGHSVIRLMRNQYSWPTCISEPIPIEGIHIVIKKGKGIHTRYENYRLLSWDNIKFNLVAPFRWENKRYFIKLHNGVFQLFYKTDSLKLVFVDEFEHAIDAAYFAVETMLPINIHP
jgi:hypothetical protein